MDSTGNWTSGGTYMFLSGYTDTRQSGSWADTLSSGAGNSTGRDEMFMGK